MSVGRPPGRFVIGLARLVHPFPSLLVTAVTVALIPFADPGAAASTFVALGLGMLCFQFAIGAANDVVDAASDAVEKPAKPIPSGRISRRAAGVAVGLLVVAGLSVTLVLPGEAWYVGLAGLACGLLYDAGVKRTALSWLPFAIAFPLIPVWVFTATGTWTPFLWVVFPLGGLLGLAVHLANQAPDVSLRGEPSLGLPGVLGRGRAASLAVATYGAAASLATLALVAARPVGYGWAAAAVAGVTVPLASRATRAFGRDGLFGLLAVSSGVLGVVLVSAA